MVYVVCIYMCVCMCSVCSVCMWYICGVCGMCMCVHACALPSHAHADLTFCLSVIPYPLHADSLCDRSCSSCLQWA